MARGTQRILTAAMEAALGVAASYGALISDEARRRALYCERGAWTAIEGELVCPSCGGAGREGDGEKCRGTTALGCNDEGRAVCRSCDAVVRVGVSPSCDCKPETLQ